MITLFFYDNETLETRKLSTIKWGIKKNSLVVLEEKFVIVIVFDVNVLRFHTSIAVSDVNIVSFDVTAFCQEISVIRVGLPQDLLAIMLFHVGMLKCTLGKTRGLDYQDLLHILICNKSVYYKGETTHSSLIAGLLHNTRLRRPLYSMGNCAP
jgi:hypothetical protein